MAILLTLLIIAILYSIGSVSSDDENGI